GDNHQPGSTHNWRELGSHVISNAVKFTPEGGTVSVASTRDEGGSVCLKISDTGIGMNGEEISTALSSFGQVDSGLDRKHEGAGLGLPLTRGLVDLHGGTLQVESEKGQGTVITIHFPPERTL
ncbi:MAG: hybrid sensor histidine kinase/response regulator, partial [Rhodospirillales bacterium]|nr:hybrid sensor histidine kinase/response regulator [Rhodospirillales bacterium]